MTLTKWLWLTASVLLWIACTLLATAFLLRKRAESSIYQLGMSEDPQPLVRTQTNLAHVHFWLRIAWMIKGKRWNDAAEQLSPLFYMLEQLIVSGSVPETNAKVLCSECSSLLQNHLVTISSLMEEIKITYQTEARLEKNQATLELQRQGLLRLHVLIAGDFADLLGSTPAYQKKGHSELLFYESGAFKWLPLLDDSLPQKQPPSVQPVDDLSNRLATLKERSEKIVKDYNSLTHEMRKNSTELPILQRRGLAGLLRIKNLALEGLKEELKIQH
jgi:hypothetical protein